MEIEVFLAVKFVAEHDVVVEYHRVKEFFVINSF
jgi:hypothetical protein